ncbi:MAG: leukotoxin LktA family filamentous adhesin, partial [Methyloversatilis sp.]|nr:leukotoxin LktA family filamentous adhesin [Methyloversatilis sp.]
MKYTRNCRSQPRLHALAAALGTPKVLLAGLSGIPLLWSQAAWSQSIQTDGRTLTTVTTAGAVTDVRTGTISGNAGFNSFKSFNVNAGHTANLHVPAGAVNLVNIVRDTRTDIQGTLNAIRDGRIGGNVYFANPHGFVVGAGGVVNVGSLSVSTPTQGFVDRFFNAAGQPDAGAVGQLLDGTAPLGAGGLIRIDGRINAVDGVALAAGTVSVAGAVFTGARFEGVAPDFGDVVNAQGLAAGSRVVERAGRIYITAEEDIEIAGTLDARGGSSTDGGEISLRAGRDILIDIDAMVTAAGDGEGSDGGRIDSLAQRNALMRSGAVMDASAGASGNGGFIEFSAKDTVSISGAAFRASAGEGGTAGHILIDPDKLLWTGSGFDMYSSGALLELKAEKEIILDNVFLSSRKVDGGATRANHQTAASTGASGEIRLVSKKIELKNGTQVLANADSGFAAGKVSILATDNQSTPVFGSVEDSIASISVSNAVIRGGDVQIKAEANDKWVWTGNEYGDTVLDFLGSLRVGANITFSTAHATVDLINGASIDASGTLDVQSVAKADATMRVVSSVVGFGYGETDAQAKLNIGQASLGSDGAMTLKSQADSTLTVKVDTVNTGAFSNALSSASKYANFSFAVGIGKQLAETTVGSNAVISRASSLTVEATGEKSHSIAASGGSFRDGIASAGVSVAITDTTMTASLGGQINAGQVVVKAALADDAETEVSAAAGTGGRPDLQESITSARPVDEILFEKLSDFVSGVPSTDERSGSSSKLGLSAAFAWAENSNALKAEVAGSARLTTPGSLSVLATAEESVSYETSAAVDQRELDTQLPGDPNPPAEKKKIAISASVAVIDMTHHADALIGDGAVIDAGGAVTVSASTVITPFWDQWVTAYGALSTMNWSDPNAWLNLGIKLKDLVADPANATSWVQTAVESEKLSFAGAVDFFSLDSKATARVGAASINANALAPTAAQDLTVSAKASHGILNLVGVPEFDPSTLTSGNTDSGSAGFGGSYHQFNLTGGSDATIAGGAQVRADDVVVLASTDFDQVTVAEAAGKAGKVSINGAFSLVNSDIETIAQIAAGSTLNTGNVVVQALDDSMFINVAGGVARSGSVGIGFSIAINDLDRDTRALIGNRSTESTTGGTLTARGNVWLEAHSGATQGAFTVAGSGPAGEEKTDGKTGGDGKSTNSADSGKQGKSGVGISASVSVNLIDDTTVAGVSGLTSLSSGGTAASNVSIDADADGTGDSTFVLGHGLTAKARNDALALSGAGSLTVGTGKSAGLAGAFTWNQLEKITRATITGTQITVGGTGSLLLDAYNTGPMWSVSAGAANGQKAGVAGSVAYSTVDNTTEAAVDGAVVNAGGSVSLVAKDDSDIRSVAGAASYGGKAGIGAGVAISTVDSDTLAEFRGSGQTVHGGAGVSAHALSDNDIVSVAATIGASQGVTATGSVTVNLITNRTRAASTNVLLTSPGAINLDADDVSSILSIAGSVALSTSSAGVGIAAAYNEIGNETLAQIEGGGANGASVRIEATEDADIQAIAAAGSGSAKVGVSGSLGINTITSQTTASSSAATLVATGDVGLRATDMSEILSITGAASGAGNAAVGAAGSYNEIGGGVTAELSGGSANGANVRVDAERKGTLDVWAIAGSAAGTAGFAGSIALNNAGGATTARIDDGAVVSTTGNAVVTAEADDFIKSRAGSAAFGGSFGGAGGIAFNDIQSTTTAEVSGANTSVTGLGNGAGDLVDNGTLSAYTSQLPSQQPLSGRQQKDSVKGVSVVASSTAMVENFALSMSGGGNAAVAATVGIAMMGGSTTAQVTGGAKLNASLGTSDQEARIAAYHHDQIGSITGGGAVGGDAGVGGAADTAVVSHVTTAKIDNAKLQANRAVTVDAGSTSKFEQAIVAVGGGTYAGLAGTIGVLLVDGTTQALVNNGDLESQGSIRIEATSDTEVDIDAGALAVSGVAGVGITAAVTVVEQATLARVSGTSRLDADGATTVRADSEFEQEVYAATAAAAGGVGIAGTINVVLAKGTTDAQVGTGVQINSDTAFGGTAAQAVYIDADDRIAVENAVGGLGVGLGGVGVGAAVDVVLVRSGASATVASGVQITADGDISVTADSVRDVHSTTVAAAGGSTAGIAGAVSVISIGTRPDGDASENSSGSVGKATELASRSATGNQIDSDTDAADDSAARADTARAGINASGDFNATPGNTSAAATVASGATLTAGGNVEVLAHTRSDTDAEAVGAAVSGGLSLGGGIAISMVEDRTVASLASTTSANGTVLVRATDDQPDVSKLRTYAGGAGVASLAASFAWHEKSSTATASLGGKVTATSGSVTVNAKVDHNLDAEGGAAAVGVVGIGAAIAYVDETSSAEAKLLAGADITAASLDVYGQSRTTSKGEVIAAAGGIVAGAGADANVSDVSAAKATVGDNVKVTTTGGLTQIRADSDPVAEAVTVGIAVSAGLSIGVSLAEATVDTDSLVTIGTGFDVTAHGLSLTAQTLPRSGRRTASADALAAGGGLLVGATATEAIATVTSGTRVQLGTGHDIDLTGAFTVLSKSIVSGLSDVSGIAVGFIAAGGNSAETTVDSTTEALIGAGDITAGSIVIRSESSDTLDAQSESGAGGLGVLLAASVVNDADAITTTQVAGTLRAATVDIDAKHTTDFQGTADSTSASVAGYSGAWVTSTVDNTTKVELSNGTRIENAQTVDIDAETRVIKGSAGADWTVQAASGGILSGASGASVSTIRNDTDVVIGSNAFIGSSVAGLNAGAIRIGAKNDVDVYDAVLLDTGGAIAIAHTESFIKADRNDADITVGAGTLLQSDGDIVLDARTEAVVDTEAQSKTYGLAGAPSGESLSRIITSNDIHLNGARLESEENIRLLAGHNNNLVADAETRLWNKTVIPINSVPDAHGEIRQDNRIDIAAYSADLTGISGIREQQIARAAVASVKDIDLKAGEGSHTTRGYGSGTDLYREALEALGKIFDDDISLDIKGGSQFTDSRSGVEVNGTVFAGTRHHQYLEFAANGSVLRQSENMSFSRRSNVSLQREIQSRIDALQLLYNEYINDNPDVANGFLNDIQILQARQTQLGVGATVNFVDVNPAAAYTGNISISGDWLKGASSAELIAPGDSIIEVINNGNQFLRIKPGVAALDCAAALCIPGEAGGLVTLNGVRVSSTAEINARNQYGQVASFAAGNVVDRTNSPDPKILLKNTYEDPVNLNALKPEIHVDGDLSNARGIVKIESTGSVLVASNVVAQTIDIATKGDFIKTFSLGFSHLAGDPSLYDVVAGYINSAGNFVNGYQQQYEAIAKSEFGVASGAFSTSPWYNTYKAYSVANAGLTSEGSTIAGNNVFISGEKLNINGLIQSGLTDYRLTINSTVLNQAKVANGGWIALELPSAGSTLADVFRPKVRWDSASNTLELGSIQVEGGYMQFYGDIFSTGNGQLKVRDGYGRIEVSNTSGANLALNRLDTGSAAAGTIKIIDTSTKLNGKPLETVIKRLNGQVTYTQTNASSDGLRPTVNVLGDSSGRLATYNPRAQRRFKWINAETYDIYKWETYSKSLLFDAAFLDALSKDPGGRSGGDTTTTRTERISGDWLAQDNRSADYIMDFTKTRSGVATKGVDSLWVVDSYGSDCAGDLCVSKTYVSRKEWEWTERNYYVHSLNASKGINIQFIGHDTGLLNVSSNGALALQGAVRNLTGNTSLSGTGIAAGDVAQIVAGNLTMTATNGSIGGPAMAGSNHIKLDLQGTGALTASATGGIALWETKGDMRIVNVSGGNGSLIDLKADANLVDENGSANNIVGGFVRLTSENARVGSIADPLDIDVRSSTGWIEASGGGDIGLTETDGDMRLLSVTSIGGDVRLQSVNGSIVDVNEAQQVDLETRAQLLQVAQRARLTASAGASQSVDNTLEAYNDQKEQDYLQYWQMRGLKENFDSDGKSLGLSAADFDAAYSFVLDAQTDQALRTANGWGDAEIAAYQNQRTAFFHQAAAEFGTGDVATFDKDFAYDVAAQDSTRAAALKDGGTWTEGEVTNRVAAGLFKDTSDTEVLIEEANVTGRNVQLIAARGIGKDSESLTIGTSPGAWSEDDQLALIAAERADVRIDTTTKT